MNPSHSQTLHLFYHLLNAIKQLNLIGLLFETSNAMCGLQYSFGEIDPFIIISVYIFVKGIVVTKSIYLEAWRWTVIVSE